MPPTLTLIRPANFFVEAAPVSLFDPHRRSDVLLPMETGPETRSRRRRLWELATTLHCSVIGTCLANADLRRVFVKLGSAGAETADEHDLHVRAVTAAGGREASAKFLQKALDKRHAAAIRHYATAKDDAMLARLWEESLHAGDVAGGYWALLSHPHATDALAKKAFQDVHMLSHLIGAANHADIRRLRQLESENEALANKLRRQETHLRDGFRFRDHTIQLLRGMLAHGDARLPTGATLGCDGDDSASLHGMIGELNGKLAQETARCQRLEQRLHTASTSLQATRADLRIAERERVALARDLGAMEQEIVRLIEPARSDANLYLAGDTFLYVGGQTRRIPQIRAWVERAGGRFLHHDGGIEHSSSLLPGLVGRADVLCFPVDCISHDAVAVIKKLCRRTQKPYLPLRTCSVAALISALTEVSHTAASTGVANGGPIP